MAAHWLLTGTAVLAALTALIKARRVSKRLERLTESYWELRYEHGQLRARVARLDPEPGPAAVGQAQQPQGHTPLHPLPQQMLTDQAGTTAFVPLSALKR